MSCWSQILALCKYTTFVLNSINTANLNRMCFTLSFVRHTRKVYAVQKIALPFSTLHFFIIHKKTVIQYGNVSGKDPP